MKILKCHNYYQVPGGEDEVFHNECALLERHGHTVVKYMRHNDDIKAMPRWETAVELFWSARTYREIRALIRQEHPDIVHVHNFFPLISPSIFYAAKAERVPVILSLDNQRLMCPSANFTRDGRLCVECLGKFFAFPGVKYRCYRGSFLLTGAVAFMTAIHKWIGTWDKVITRNFVSTEFYRKLFLKHGIASASLCVKPHMVVASVSVLDEIGAYAFFLGRLDPEKGAMVLLEAWKILKERGYEIPLKIRGEGRLRQQMDAFLAEHGLKGVDFIGRLSREELSGAIQKARFLVWPSLGYYETFGLAAVEAQACGVPVIASKIGVLEVHVQDGRTGLHFEPGNARDLADKVLWAWEHSCQMQEMGRSGRQVYEAYYCEDAVYRVLLKNYTEILGQANMQVVSEGK